jgi:beta-lactam-binding protein with PASTA domain
MARVGTVFADRYEIQRELARGGMADVYLATDRQLRRPVAVKVLFAEFARDPNFVERFRREAQNAASLNHPNICAVYDWGQERGTYYIVMEYVEGRSLSEIVREQGPLPAMTAARIASDLADALAFAHRRGVVHRDVKPGNVLCTPTGQIKLTDFGIAANRFDADAGLTQTGSVMGTATYFSPEQAQGHPVDGRSDVYALGVVLYEMCTGVPPFSGDSPVAVAMKHVREVPPPMTARVPDLPPPLQAIVGAALTKDVALRYQSAEEMRTDLLDFGRGRPLTFAYESAGGPTPGGTAPPTVAAARTQAVLPAVPETRGRNWSGIVAAVLGLGLLGAVVLYLLVGTGGGEGGTDAPTVEVPSVVGNSFEQASGTITAAGFTVSRLDDEQSAQAAGTVIGQDPVGGRLAAKGSAITVTVASNQVTLPPMVGQDYDTVTTALQRLSLTVERKNVDSDRPPGTILAANPAAGTKVARGSTVTLEVAAIPGVDVPPVAGRPQQEALDVLRAAGFQPVVTAQASATVPEGEAIGTLPTVGTRATRGSPVTLLVSSGPEQVPVPNVTGQTTQAAVNALAGAGFGTVVQQVTGRPPGVVFDQNPRGGTLPRGAAVTIFVGV